MIIIKIILIGSYKRAGIKLKSIIKRFIKNKDYDVDFEEINNKYGMKDTCLIIDDRIVLQGEKFNEKEINNILNRCVLS